MESKTIRGFKVITSSDNSKEFLPSPPTLGVQEALFPFDTSHLLVFVSFPEVSEEEFVSALNSLHPRVIIELRKAPRFDIGKLNRQVAFDCFQRIGSRYFDLIAEYSAEEKNEQMVFTKVQKIVREHSNEKSPFMFLVSETDRMDIKDAVLDWLKGSGERWLIFDVPQQGDFKHKGTESVS